MADYQIIMETAFDKIFKNLPVNRTVNGRNGTYIYNFLPFIFAQKCKYRG